MIEFYSHFMEDDDFSGQMTILLFQLLFFKKFCECQMMLHKGQ